MKLIGSCDTFFYYTYYCIYKHYTKYFFYYSDFTKVLTGRIINKKIINNSLTNSYIINKNNKLYYNLILFNKTVFIFSKLRVLSSMFNETNVIPNNIFSLHEYRKYLFVYLCY